MARGGMKREKVSCPVEKEEVEEGRRGGDEDGEREEREKKE